MQRKVKEKKLRDGESERSEVEFLYNNNVVKAEALAALPIYVA